MTTDHPSRPTISDVIRLESRLSSQSCVDKWPRDKWLHVADLLQQATHANTTARRAELVEQIKQRANG